MPMYDTYSKRKRRAEQGDEPEVFEYHHFSEKLRTQLRQIFSGAIGYYDDAYGEFSGPPSNNDAWEAIAKILRREFGVDKLSVYASNPYSEIMRTLDDADVDRVLDVVELCCRWIERVLAKQADWEREKLGIDQEPNDAIREVNARLREAGAGYEYSNGEIIRVDSRLLHAEVVRPALSLLRDPRFKGPEDEFLHAHYRNGNAKEAVTAANSAFESTMKAICDIKGWAHPAGSRASDLVKVLRRNGLFPDYLDNAFDQLVATLASGLPQVRNNDGGHGQGAAPKQTPDYVASYALHLCAANIVLLVEAAQL
jgi:hypothetical protein